MKYKLMDYLRWAGEAVAVIAIIVLFFMWNGQRKKTDIEITRRVACENAPVKRIVMWRAIPVIDTFYVEPKPMYYEPAKPAVEEVEATPCKSTYTFPYRWQPNDSVFGRFNINMVIKDCKVERMELSEIFIPEKTILERRTVDTCIDKIPAYRPKNHWLLQASIIGNSFKKFPNFDMTVNYTIKDYVLVGAGGEYNAYHNELYAKIQAGIYLDKLFKH